MLIAMVIIMKNFHASDKASQKGQGWAAGRPACAIACFSFLFLSAFDVSYFPFLVVLSFMIMYVILKSFTTVLGEFYNSVGALYVSLLSFV